MRGGAQHEAGAALAAVSGARSSIDAPAPSAAPRPVPPEIRIGWREHGIALLLALAWVVALDLLTNSTAPVWDAESYVDMAQNGIAENPHLVAPFAYRPAVPWLAGTIARLADIEVESAFAIVARVGALATLVLAWRLARALRASEGVARAVQGATALAFAHVKLPLFFPTLVDGPSYVPYLLAFVAWVERRVWLALACALLGLAFKEFALVPCALVALDAACARPRRRWVLALAALAGTALVFAGIRAAIHVERSQQFVDTSSFDELRLWLLWVPRKWDRDLNLVLALAAYLLPVLMLSTRERWRAVRASAALGPPAWTWWAALALVAFLALYGGTNLATFASYALPVQIAWLCAFARERISRAELICVLIALVIYNRALWPLPSPREEFDAYIDGFYGPWGSRLNARSAWRALEVAGWIAAAWTVRALSRRARAVST